MAASVGLDSRSSSFESRYHTNRTNSHYLGIISTVQTPSKLILLLIGISGGISSSHAQQPAISQNASTTGQSTASSPASEKALIYVYREGSIIGLAGSPILFANNSFLAVLNNSRYAQIEMPPGTVVVGATISLTQTQAPSVYVGLGQYLPPTLRWPRCAGNPKKPSCSWDVSASSQVADDHGCAKVDWQHVDNADPEDLALCGRELNSTSAALDNWLDPVNKSAAILFGALIPGAIGNNALSNALNLPGGDIKAWLQMCGPDPFPARTSQEVDKIKRDLKRGDTSDNWSRCSNQTAAADLMLQIKKRVRIEAEAGKTYYVKWSAASASGGKMTLEDEVTGAKGIKGLHPVEAAVAPTAALAGDAQPSGPPPLSINLPADSAAAIADTGLVFLLKHIGFASITADLYVISGKPGGEEPIRTFTNDRVASDAYIARFASADSCKGNPATVDGYQVWCFKVKSNEVSRKHDKAQNLGIVTSNGRRFKVQAVDLHLGGACKVKTECYGVDAEVSEEALDTSPPRDAQPQ
jgi:hypothetical protein